MQRVSSRKCGNAAKVNWNAAKVVVYTEVCGDQ